MSISWNCVDKEKSKISHFLEKYEVEWIINERWHASAINFWKNYKYQSKYSSDVTITMPILATGQKYNGVGINSID